MLFVENTRREERPKASCPKRAHTSAERASFGYLRLLRSPRGFASLFHSLRHPSLKNNFTRSGSPPFISFVKTLHASAPLRGAMHASLRAGFALAHCCGAFNYTDDILKLRLKTNDLFPCYRNIIS